MPENEWRKYTRIIRTSGNTLGTTSGRPSHQSRLREYRLSMVRLIFIVLVLAVFLTVICNYQTLDWLTNYIKCPDPSAEVEPEKNPRRLLLEELIELVSMKNPGIYEEITELVSSKYPDLLEEIMELVSPKDPKCRPNNSTSDSDPFSNLERTTTIHFAHLLLSLVCSIQ